MRKPYVISKQRERWTDAEHELFLEALREHGRAWRKIEGAAHPGRGGLAIAFQLDRVTRLFYHGVAAKTSQRTPCLPIPPSCSALGLERQRQSWTSDSASLELCPSSSDCVASQSTSARRPRCRSGVTPRSSSPSWGGARRAAGKEVGFPSQGLPQPARHPPQQCVVSQRTLEASSVLHLIEIITSSAQPLSFEYYTSAAPGLGGRGGAGGGGGIISCPKARRLWKS